MMAKTAIRPALALLALATATTAAVWGQARDDADRDYGDRNYADRDYGDRNYADGQSDGQYDGRRAAESAPRVAQDALRATEVAPNAGDDGRTNPIRDNRGQTGQPLPNNESAAQPNAQPNAQANAQLRPAAPFQLTPQQQRFIDELLAAWEKHSSGIKTFECDFTRWEYTPNFGPVNAQGQLAATAISSGEMKYIKPDKGLFHVTETRIYNKSTGKYDKAGDEVGEHWVCDGKVVWEVDARLKQLRENPIPPEMQGEQIANGPLPFMLFGGEAAKLKARYFLREQTHPQFAQEEIWLESYPRWAGDAANYRSAHLIMKRADFLPYALRLYSNNGTDYTVFEFRKIKLNNVFMSDIKQPKVPSDWQLIRAPIAAAAERQGDGGQRQ